MSWAGQDFLWAKIGAIYTHVDEVGPSPPPDITQYYIVGLKDSEASQQLQQAIRNTLKLVARFRMSDLERSGGADLNKYINEEEKG